MEKSEIQRSIERNGIIISRIPSWAKELFQERSKEEFCNDYGMCLAAMMKECHEFNSLKNMFFENKMNIKLIMETNEQKEGNKETIKFANGKKIELKGGKQ